MIRGLALLAASTVLAAACGTSGGDHGAPAKAQIPTPTSTFVTRGCQGCSDNALAPGPSSPLRRGAGRIAFVRATTAKEADIWVAATDASAEQRLTNASGLDLAPSWSPDGRRIVFVSDRGGRFALYSMHSDGSGQRRLAGSPSGDASTPAWSPDGRSIAYASAVDGVSTVHVIDAAGRAGRAVATGSFPSFAPDSRRLVITTGSFSRGSLAIVDLANRRARPLNLPLPNAHEASWSPDGRTIVFSSSATGFAGPPDEWNEELYRVDPAGRNLRRLTIRSGNDHWLVAWSPDSGRIAWTADDLDGSADVYIARADGKRIRRLTSSATYDAWPAWAPTPQS